MTKTIGDSSFDNTPEKSTAKENRFEETNWRRVLIEGSRDGIVVVDREGRVYDTSKKFAHTLGYTVDELFNLRIWDWEGNFSKDQIIQMLVTVDEKGDHFETRHRRKDGSLVDVEICSNAAELDGKKLIFCVCRDITDRLNYQKALRNSKARLAALSDASFESIFLSGYGICLDQNLSAQRMFGYTREEAVGRLVTDWIVPEDREIAKNNVLSGYEKPYEITALRKDGSMFPAEVQGRMLRYNERKIRVTAVRDITDRKRAQKEKMEAISEAAESKKLALVGQVAGKMAHDFNNILGIILGTTELALMAGVDPGLKESLEIILEQCIRGKNLTKNLIAFAKDQEPKQEFFSINEKIELILNLMKKDLEGIIVVHEYGRREPDLLADPGMIEHAIINIIQNSIHATSLVDQPEIVILTSHLDDNIHIELTDNGCGIPEEFMDRIFEPSFTLKGSRDRTLSYKGGIKGTGYGMANVKKYVEKHKGQITVSSKPEKGTTVSILLPLTKKELTRQEIETINRDAIRCHDKYILLVEDEQALADIQYMVLTQKPCHHHVDIASNGRVAQDLFNRNDYDLVSLDYTLPGEINGMDVYRYIRKTNKTVPVLFISGNIEFLESIKDLKKNDPYTGHLSKPCMNVEYLNCINHLLQKLTI